MNPSKELFTLIKSLSGSEKRYFKVNSSKHIIGEGNNYVALFDAIDKQNEYDENKIKQEPGSEKFTTHFAWRKNYLYNQILDSLLAYHLNLSGDSVLRKEMQQVRILYEKGLYEQCDKLLSRVKKKAEELENFPSLFDVFKWKKKLMFNASYFRMTRENILTFFEEEKKIIRKQENFSEYSNLLHILYYQYSRKGTIRNNKLKKLYDLIIKTPLLKDPSKAICIRSKRAFYNIHSIYYLFIDVDYEKAHKYTRQHVKLIESSPSQVEDDIHGYLTSLNNFIINCYMIKKYNEAYQGLEKMKNISQKFKVKLSFNQQMKIFVRATLAEINMMSRTLRYENFKQMLPEIEKGLDKYKGKIEAGKEAIICYNVAEVFFLQENYKKALEWSNRILYSSHSEVEQNILAFTKLFQLVIHYELKNYDLVHYSLKSATRFLGKKQRIHTGETIILKCLKLLIDNKGFDKKKIHLTKALQQFIELRAHNKLEQRILSYFDFITWAKSKIHKVPMIELLKKA